MIDAVPPIAPVRAGTALGSSTSLEQRLAHLYGLLSQEEARPGDPEPKKRRIAELKRRVQEAEATAAEPTPHIHFDGQTHLLDTLA